MRSRTTYTICAGCPASAAIETALELSISLGKEAYTTKSPEGLLTVAKQALEGVVQKVGCDKPERSDTKQLVCPLEQALSMTKMMTLHGWNNLAVDASALVDTHPSDEPSTNNGTYL